MNQQPQQSQSIPPTLEDAITVDMTAVFALIARVSKYGYEADFKAMMLAWSLDLGN